MWYIKDRTIHNEPDGRCPWLWTISSEDYKKSDDPIWHATLRAWDLYNDQSFDAAIAILEDFDSPTIMGTVLMGMCYLAKGDLKKGWPLYEQWHNNTGDPELYKKFMATKWKGDHVDNLLVWNDQALGDCIQYLRYIPLVQDCCLQLRLGIKIELRQLVADSFPGIVQTDKRIYSPCQAPITSLASIFGFIPKTVPYLKAGIIKSKANIGVCWKTDTSIENGNLKSIPYELIKPLMDKTGAISLQKEDLNVTNIADTAAIINGLDLVISVDTMVAHLAGALGKPTWVMLMKNCAWTWYHDHVWYPTVIKFRQSQKGDWNSVLHDIEEKLDGYKLNQGSRVLC